MDLLNMLLNALLGVVSANPTLLKIVVLVGTLRLVLKPIMLAIDQIVVATPTQADDSAWGKVKASNAYKVVSLVLDYIGSIKLPQA